MKQQMIALVGLSGSGKTTIGPLLAKTLGWQYLDTDQLVAAGAGQPVPDIFAQQGEAAFRRLEAEALQHALDRSQIVLATGGGVIEDVANRALLEERAFTVWLHAPVATLVERLADVIDRPLLADAPAQTLHRMAARRAPLYGEVADWIVATEHLSPQHIVDEIVRAYHQYQPSDPHNNLLVTTPGGSYPVRAGHGVLDELPQWLDRLGVRGRVWLLSNTSVLPLHGERVQSLLQAHGRTVHAFAIPDGEAHKSLNTLAQVYDWLLGNGVERGDVLVALGGGVVGDLGGFAAATVLRGIAVIQLPTTVLAMVDSAIGGKTGVDHPVGKNLIGAFHQPRLVLADTGLLTTLPHAERAAGWAEAIKHGVIGDPALFYDLYQHADAVLNLAEPITGDLIRRAAAYKVAVVSGDEREQGGRIMLNYGHTLGHAIEAESGYTLRHGAAVAIGMMAAGTLAVRLGVCDRSALDQQQQVLKAFGLPTRIPATIDQRRVIERIASDKKVRASRVRWVLPTRIGATVVRDDVPLELVAEVVREVAATPKTQTGVR